MVLDAIMVICNEESATKKTIVVKLEVHYVRSEQIQQIKLEFYGILARGSNQPIDCKREATVAFQRNLETTTSPLKGELGSDRKPKYPSDNFQRTLAARQNVAGNRSCKESGSVLSNELPGEREQTRTKRNRKKRNEKNSQTRFIPALLLPAKLGSYSRFLLAWLKFVGEFQPSFTPFSARLARRSLQRFCRKRIDERRGVSAARNEA